MADTCPDCNKHYMRNYADNSGCDRIRNSSLCATATISRLRARVAELEQAHAEQVAEREHLDAIYRSAKRALASHQFEKLEDAKRHIAALEAERARQAKGDKP